MRKKIIFLLCCLIIAGLPLAALDKAFGQITDDSELRRSIKESWFMESPVKVLLQPGAVHRLAGGGRVELRAEAANDEFMIILARELVNTANGNNAVSGHFPGWAQGSWILTRNLDTGAAVRIRIFPRSDPYTYIQFRPFGTDRSYMDVVLYDAYFVRSLPLPVSLERLYTMPLNDALKLAGNKFPLKYFEPNPADYSAKRNFISAVRNLLPGLNFADDGAIDQNGNYVYINTGALQTGEAGLNCSGFAKWLIDGILRPVTGERLAIPPLKQPFGSRGSSFTDVWEELRDPFFGLDWIRNLASQAWTTLRSAEFAGLEEFEVRDEPFSRIIVRKGRESSVQHYPAFLQDAGYGTEGLLPLLYSLAINEPGRFYLAAVNNESGPPTTPDNLRGRPRLRQYFHVAALVPYFNEYGVFQVAVFESAAETSINAFRNRYPGHCVSLVRIPIESAFSP